MRPKILTIDDSKTIRNIILKMFDGYDCEVLEAENGVEGLAQAGKHHPNLIILDIDMPQMNGLEMLTHLRNNDKFMHTPVFMLTSKSKAKNVKMALDLGVKAYIAKPFKRDELLGKVKELIKLDRA